MVLLAKRLSIYVMNFSDVNVIYFRIETKYL